jgi:hypothetical protein
VEVGVEGGTRSGLAISIAKTFSSMARSEARGAKAMSNRRDSSVSSTGAGTRRLRRYLAASPLAYSEDSWRTEC